MFIGGMFSVLFLFLDSSFHSNRLVTVVESCSVYLIVNEIFGHCSSALSMLKNMSGSFSTSVGFVCLLA